jgi:predicted nuclease of predicted toxin-antitoxin system
LRFLVDAQLPPGLAAWLRERGHDANHVRDFGLEAVLDHEVARKAVADQAIIVTKDSDFSRLSANHPGCRVLWLRLGNGTVKNLLHSLEPVIAEAEQAFAEGQTFVEVGR